MTKKLRDFYFKNPSVRAFLKGIDKRDEKFIINMMSNIEMESGERVIRSGTYERAIYLVGGGELTALSDDRNTIYQEGAILGVEQFLFNKPWVEDYFCKSQATLCKFTYDEMIDMVNQNAVAAGRLYRRIVRHYCYSQIYSKKQDNIHLFKFKNIDDDQLFIDFKLDTTLDKERELFSLMSQSRPESERTTEGQLNKEDTLKLMPYFISSQF